MGLLVKSPPFMETNHRIFVKIYKSMLHEHGLTYWHDSTDTSMNKLTLLWVAITQLINENTTKRHVMWYQDIKLSTIARSPTSSFPLSLSFIPAKYSCSLKQS